MHGRARLPRRGREALLLGAARAAAREDVGAHHGAHGRGLPSRQARRRACALLIEPQAHDGARAHAVEPSALCRLDAGAPQAAGRRDRAATRRRWSRSSCASARTPSRASAPASASCGSPRPTAASGWRPPAAGRSTIGARSYTSVNSILKNNLDRRRPANRHGRAGDSCTPTSVAPATSTEEMTRMLTHPTLDQLRALKLDGMAEAFVELQAQDRAKDLEPRRMAGAAARPRGGEPQHPALPEPAARAPGCATARRRSRTSTTARRAGSTRRCSSSSPPAAGSPSTAICSSPGRAASASRGSPARWRRRPAATATPCTTPACRGCSPISSSPTATAASHGCSARSPRPTC